MACFWPRSGKQERSAQVPSFHAACGPDHHATCARCGPVLCRILTPCQIPTPLACTRVTSYDAASCENRQALHD
ncbi:hypothetical protein M9458_055905, partial [Cirrhinus mrigala]